MGASRPCGKIVSKLCPLMKIVRFLRLRLVGVLLVLSVCAQVAYPCSLMMGYFHQATNLHGTVVGVANRDLRHPVRSLRQKVTVTDATMKLYEYSGSLHLNQMHLVKEVKTTAAGEFDFGQLPEGHYTLAIEVPWGADYFDVQIVSLQSKTKNVTIDVSPIYPDCTGGREFIVTSE